MAALNIWTVYDHPLDFPDCFVARLFLTDADGPVPTSVCFRSESLDHIRATLADQGLTVMPRMDGDDAKIVEVWL